MREGSLKSRHPLLVFDDTSRSAVMSEKDFSRDCLESMRRTGQARRSRPCSRDGGLSARRGPRLLIVVWYGRDHLEVAQEYRRQALFYPRI
jgi:hypothetical protein